jgi:hypothetical protein
MSFSAETKTDQPVAPWTQVSVAGVEYSRLPLRTRWLDEADDLVLALKEHLELARPGDTIGVSEKVVILLTGQTVDINTVQPGRLARMLAGHVRPRGDHARGLSVPEKMEYVVRTVGRWRIIAAALLGALTRPLGMRGTFYSYGVRACAPAAVGHQSRPADLRRPRAGARPRRQHRRPQRLRRLDPRGLSEITVCRDADNRAQGQPAGPTSHQHALCHRSTRLRNIDSDQSGPQMSSSMATRNHIDCLGE